MSKKHPAYRDECLFSKHQLDQIDYDDVEVLKHFISGYKKILPRRYTGLSAKNQRKMAKAVKRARIMSLLPFTSK